MKDPPRSRRYSATAWVAAVLGLTAAWSALVCRHNKLMFAGREGRILSVTGGMLVHDPATRTQKSAIDANLTIAAFGSSRTWGSTLEDPSTQAYVKLLNPKKSENFGIRATGADWPSLCTHSMVGDSLQLDVIILEFWLGANEHLVRLARRLRQRFPDATIVLLRIWGPLSFRLKSTGQTMADWAKDQRLDYSDPRFPNHLIGRTEAEDWVYTMPTSAQHFQDVALENVEGILLELPRPMDPRLAIRDYGYIFADDMKHLSRQGHEWVANSAREILIERNVQPSDARNEWEFRDFCEDWFMTGRPSEHLLPLDNEKESGVAMVEFDRRAHKFALEMRDQQVRLHVFNSFDAGMPLFLRYMKAYPEPGIYPASLITFQGQTFGVDPTGHDSRGKIHVNKIIFVGYIPEGWSEFSIKRVEEGKPYPLRITGFMLSPTDEAFTLDNALETREAV